MEGQLRRGTVLTSESGGRYTVKQLLGAGPKSNFNVVFFNDSILI